MPHVLGKAQQTRSVFKAREAQLVEGDRRKPGQGHLQGVMMKDGEAKERQARQDEIDRDPQKAKRVRVPWLCVHSSMEGDKNNLHLET